MMTFAIAGSIYLVGVGIVLFIKPSLMFTPDGDWKEFGIGQREDRYTPFPFWLFCLSWAILAYFLVLLVKPYVFPQNSKNAYRVEPLPPPELEDMTNFKKRNNRRRNVEDLETLSTPRSKRGNTDEFVEDLDVDEAMELPKGYYVLNKKATRLSGVPKYVYLGPEEPAN
jgi:hypothetical protein